MPCSGNQKKKNWKRIQSGFYDGPCMLKEAINTTSLVAAIDVLYLFDFDTNK
jgi:hypothetical protein